MFEEFGPRDLLAVICLSLTNTYLYEVGQKHFRDLMLCFHGPWWLERLICVGDYLDGDVLPANIFSEEEEKTLTGNHIVDGKRQCSRIFCAFEGDYYDWSATKLKWYKIRNDAEDMKLSNKERRSMEAMMKPDFSWDGEPETEWILCNWTTAEYVRASAVASLTGSTCRGPWTNAYLGLGHVLMTQICWSTDRSASMRYDGGITRGPWAGHYFGITTVDNLSQDVNCIDRQPWTDVSKKIVREVLKIWRLDCPRRLVWYLRPADDDNSQTE